MFAISREEGVGHIAMLLIVSKIILSSVSCSGWEDKSLGEEQGSASKQQPMRNIPHHGMARLRQRKFYVLTELLVTFLNIRL